MAGPKGASNRAGMVESGRGGEEREETLLTKQPGCAERVPFAASFKNVKTEQATVKRISIRKDTERDKVDRDGEIYR